MTASVIPQLTRVASWPGLRVLAWDRDILYASRGYQLLRLNTGDLQSPNSAQWQPVATFAPVWWRALTSRNNLTYRLFRDGFHCLAIADDQTLIAAVPGAIVTCAPSSNSSLPLRDLRGSSSSQPTEFRITHRVLRGTRPLHITGVPGGNIYWGEYFDNRERAAVHIYASADRGQTWQVAHTFPARAIRHVHNIVYDRYADCLWVLTGDDGRECKILRADRDLRNIETVLEGNQQARAVAAIPTPDAIYLSTDTPFEQNHIVRLDRSGQVESIANLASSSIFGCRTANALFFSTMVEPSSTNPTREVHLAAFTNGADWQVVARWQKDWLPMRYFQYGNAILPDGENTTSYLAATTIAVQHDDLVTSLWEVASHGASPKPNAQSPIP